ncbi:hypothetical protein Emag_006335 [Eimeria magna]
MQDSQDREEGDPSPRGNLRGTAVKEEVEQWPYGVAPAAAAAAVAGPIAAAAAAVVAGAASSTAPAAQQQQQQQQIEALFWRQLFRDSGFLPCSQPLQANDLLLLFLWGAAHRFSPELVLLLLLLLQLLLLLHHVEDR